MVAALALGCASGSGDRASNDVEATRIAARVDGHAITVGEVDRHIKDELFEKKYGGARRGRLDQARGEAIQEIIDGYLVSEAAAAAGLTPEAWIEQAAAELPPPTDEEVEAFFEANRERIGEEVTFEELAPQIRAYLEQGRQSQAVDALRAAADVQVVLEPRRLQVGAAGPSRGPADAPITLVEFSDFQCPYCMRAEGVIAELFDRHPDAIRLVYRHMPLDFHRHARAAAEASVCAEAQGRFWDYHALLFANQGELGQESLLAYADELGLDRAAFEACLEDPATAERVDIDMQEAKALGATGTPTFFINGMMMTGARPLDEFDKVVQEELARVAE